MDTVPRPNSVIADRYVVERELGRGGMATVFLARDQRHDARVAVKVLHPELAPLFAGERFAREIRITAGLQHPHVVPILDSGISTGLPFYTMPYVEGESLAARLHREEQLPIADAIRIATSVADALAYAHDRGFVHRDIKPQNILLSQGHAVVADFGIARAMDVSGGERITESGVALGTAMYMSPEQGSGGRIDGRSDIYALGCVLYEMLAGSPPFTGSTPQTVLARHAVDPIPPIRTVRQTVGPALEQVIARSLAKVPADRYANAHELRAALEAAAAEQATLPATGGVRPTRSTRPSQKNIVAVLAAVVLIVSAAYALSVVRSRGVSLDSNRIAVFPLETRAGMTGRPTLGEDIATVIGHALDGTGTLRWVDGWRLLQSRRRTATDSIASASEMSAIAREKGCAYYLSGELVPTTGDSVQVLLQLFDTKSNDPVKSVREPGATADAWRLAIRAINQLLPTLIPGTTERELVSGWIDRKPEVVGAFLLGEASFRRARPAEALLHYRDALRGDSTFAIAAVRAAQAAIWEHRTSEAASLIQLAVAQPMTPRYAHFVRGYAFYIEGRAEAAAEEFRQTLALDPDMATAWMQLGETYTHLIPISGTPTLSADTAFTQALRLDSSATHALFHPIEMRLRRGQVAEAAPLVRRFLAADPDSTLADQIRIMNACVSKGASAVDWPDVVRTRPLAVVGAAQSLAAGGGQLPCAAAAYSAVRTYITPEMAAENAVVDTHRWAALVGLQGVLVAQGRSDEAAARIDTAIARGEGGHSLFIVDGTIVPELEARGAESVKHYGTQWGTRCERCTSNDRVWQLGVWATHVGDSASLMVLANELATRAKATGAPGIALMAQATAARARLARGDTAAIRALTGVLATPVDRASDLLWREQEGRGPERLALARALIARRQFQRAIDIANVFDSPASQSFVAYLPVSLKLRAAAADSLGFGGQAFRLRLDALRNAQQK
jgi:serine/threonine-protein kinase